MVRRLSDLPAVFAVIYRKLSAAGRLSPQKGSIFGGAADEKQRITANNSGQGWTAAGTNVGIGINHAKLTQSTRFCQLVNIISSISEFK
jgi:hypothetical protein